MMETHSNNLKVCRLTDGKGFDVELTNIGARIMRLRVDGVDVVQGFERPEDYLPEAHLSDFGAVVGAMPTASVAVASSSTARSSSCRKTTAPTACTEVLADGSILFTRLLKRMVVML